MAMGQTRIYLVIGRSGALLSSPLRVATPISVEGRRHLTTNPQYKKPFPYKQKSFGNLRCLIDFTSSRINENSRILQIEGPPCVGKSEFAKKIADYFQLKYLPAITEKDLFVVNGFDTRQLNEILPSKKMKAWDLDAFYTEKDPDNFKYFAQTQIRFFEQRYYQYIEALQHVLHTGQGVVLENNVWGDFCYALTLADHGYFTKKAIKWYMEYRKNVLNFLWHPHLVIHLDAPSSHVVKKMKEKNPQYEGSRVLTEKFYDDLREKYEKLYLPYMSKRLDVLTYDTTKMEDFELLAMDLESMDLISSRFGESIKFSDWKKQKEEHWSLYRRDISDPTKIRMGIDWRGPYQCPELWRSGEEDLVYQQILQKFPQLNYGYDYWHEKDGKLTSRPEANDITPLSLARKDPISMQAVEAAPVKPAKQVTASAH